MGCRNYDDVPYDDRGRETCYSSDINHRIIRLQELFCRADFALLICYRFLYKASCPLCHCKLVVSREQIGLGLSRFPLLAVLSMGVLRGEVQQNGCLSVLDNREIRLIEYWCALKFYK